MLFAMPSVRAQLGLKTRPAYDADVRAKRLVVGDDYLKKVLYGNVDTMRAAYASAPAAPKDTGLFSWFRRKEEKPAAAAPQPAAAAKPKPSPAPKPASAPKPALSAAAPPGSVKELVARGYVMKGTVSKDMTASKIAGSKWNSPDTYYTIRNKVIPGSKIDPSHIEKGMCVWMRK
jgi:hypothetical protein